MSNHNDKEYNHVLKYTGVFGGVQGLNIIIGLVRTKAIALLLGPGGMGLASLFQTAVNFVSQTTSLGISMSAIRNISELYDCGDEALLINNVRVVRTWSLLTGIVGMFVCLILGPLLNALTFTWGDHTLHFIMLSPLVGLLAITGGETAILKGTRQLGSLAIIQIYNMLAALFISVPVYYFFGQTGIIPVMILTAFVAMLLTIRKSFRLFPLHISYSRSVLGEGMDMVKVGVSFTIAGMFGVGSEFLIRTYLNNVTDLSAVGMYNVGFMMIMTYGGMIFSAMETDYFPRLSAVSNDRVKYNDLITKQAEVSLLLISPIIVAAIICLPVALVLLTSEKFLPVVDMMRIMSLSLYLRAINLPLEYLSLAKGSSKSFLFLEICYDVMSLLLGIIGYSLYGLDGLGWGLLLTVTLNFALVLSYMRWKFGVVLRMSLFMILIIHLSIGVLAFLATRFLQGPIYWMVGGALFLGSLLVTLNILRKKTRLWESLKTKLLKKI